MFVVIKLKTIKIMLCLILIVAVLSIGNTGAKASSVFFNGTYRRIPIYNVETDDNKIAISFDAAWGAEKTPELLNILDKYDVSTTFFLTGIWVDEYPDLVKEIERRGHEIGLHSNTHPNMCRLTKTEIVDELETNKNTLNTLVDQDIDLFRPPFGAYNDKLINTAEDLGLKTIQWDVDSLDWRGLSAMDITNRVLSKVDTGSIVLFHNDADNILDAINILLDRLQKRGYEIVQIGDLIIEEDYYIDSRGTQRKN